MATSAAPARNHDRRLIQVQGMPVRRWLGTTPGLLRAASVAADHRTPRARRRRRHQRQRARRRGACRRHRERRRSSSPRRASTCALSDADATALDHLPDGRATRRRHSASATSPTSNGPGVSSPPCRATPTPLPRSARAVATITEQLSGVRRPDRHCSSQHPQGNGVGAAYQRDGSKLMREQILPAATTLYQHAARGLDDNYRAGTSTNEIVLVVVAGVLVLVLLDRCAALRDASHQPHPECRTGHGERLDRRDAGVDGDPLHLRTRRFGTRAAQRVGPDAGALGSTVPDTAGTERRQPRPGRAWSRRRLPRRLRHRSARASVVETAPEGCSATRGRSPGEQDPKESFVRLRAQFAAFQREHDAVLGPRRGRRL